MDRRQFLGGLSAAVWLANPSFARAVADARVIIASGAIGPVRFCRAAGPRWLALARQVSGDGTLIAEVHAAANGAVFLGSSATLVVDRKGCRILP
jgi:hypothetical protein